MVPPGKGWAGAPYTCSMRTHALLLVIGGLLVACGGRDRGGRPGGGTTNNSVPAPRCGDGIVQTGEVCDVGQLGDLTCEIFGFGPGTLACDANCLDYDRRNCGAPATCGNGVREGNEICDGADFGELSCASFGFTGGTLACTPNCGYAERVACTGMAATCGNNQREGDEVCDGADLNGATCGSLGLGEGTLACNSSCGGYETGGCSSGCTPMCDGRACGPDPVCGTSCGTCQEGMCNAQGQCESANAMAPRILNFATNVSRITRGESVTFSAIVTDPDGISDVIGGSLETENMGVYGTFATSDNEGAYSFSLSWDDMHQVIPIEFASEATRTFVARFYDVAGNQVTGSVQITLHCDGESACDGRCFDLQTSDNHCGTCGRQCGSNTGCNMGQCVGIREMVPGQTCQQSCAMNIPGGGCQPLCSVEGSGVLSGGAGFYYCEDGMCTMSQEVRQFACGDVVPMSYMAMDMSTMTFDGGGCCCVAP